MEFFYWNASFEIGLPKIDDQHRRLVAMINALASHITEGGNLPQVGALIRDLMDYAAVHFFDEEQLMHASPLTSAEKKAHLKAHRGFVDKVQEIAERDDLLEADVAEQVLEFLTTWLVSHILASDRKIAQALTTTADETAPAGDLLAISHEVPSSEKVLINALGETERRFRLITDQAPALIWVCDPRGVRGYFNRSWTDFVGVVEKSPPRIDWRSFIHPEDLPSYLALLEDLLKAPRAAETEYRLRRPDGRYGWIFERILPRRDSGNSFMGLISAGTDITLIKQTEAQLALSNRELEAEVARRTAQLEALMLTDPLTGIGNRRMLMGRLTQEVEQAASSGGSLVAAFFDLDHFKVINDRHGHSTGDAVLVRVARCIRANLRTGDVLARFGGEEFVALMLDTSLSEAVRVAERIRAAVGRIRMFELTDEVTISVGLAEWQQGDTGDMLLAHSDRALYRAKDGGRNRCVIDDLAA